MHKHPTRQDLIKINVAYTKLPDLPSGLNPLKSCQALYHDGENPGSACTQLCLSR